MMVRYALGLGSIALIAAACGGGGPPPGNPGDGGVVTAPQTGHPPECTVEGDSALGGNEESSPAVAFAGKNIAAAWSEPSAVHIALLDTNGQLIEKHTIPAARASEPAITAMPDGPLLVSWQEGGSVRAVRLGSDGAPRGNPFEIARSAAQQSRPDSAATAKSTVVAWSDAGGAFVGMIDASKLVDRTPIPGAAAEPSLAAGDDGFGVVWTAGNKLGFARLSPPLQGMDAVMFRDAPGVANVPRAAAANGGGYWITWEDSRGGQNAEAIYLAHADGSGKVGQELRVTGTEGSADYPDVAPMGENAAVVYYQFRDGPPVVYLSLIGPDMNKIGEPLRISGHGGARFPRVAASGGALAITYAQRGGPARVAVVVCR